MAGVYQLAQRLIDDAVAAGAAQAGMNPEVLARALMTQLIEHYRQSRPIDDIVGELEQHIRSLQDGDEAVVTRGC